ncbi:hypothetical protein AA0Z99_03405 [Agrococcus sp. 1P02AA]|uniref:hypothetical protein n=1 Tax=Agrococcus sp. 1P02AA TaxID=3132259 RepID=UPI0039A5B370
MKAFRLGLDVVREAVRGTLPPTRGEHSEPGADGPAAVPSSRLDDEAVLARFAAGAWTVLPEPGDGVAGLVRAALGDVRALELLVDGASTAQWLGAVAEPELARRLPEALDRWRPRLGADRILGAFSQGAMHGQRLLTRADDAWPTAIDDLGPHAPSALWVRGDPSALAACRRSDWQPAL